MCAEPYAALPSALADWSLPGSVISVAELLDRALQVVLAGAIRDGMSILWTLVFT